MQNRTNPYIFTDERNKSLKNLNFDPQWNPKLICCHIFSHYGPKKLDYGLISQKALYICIQFQQKIDINSSRILGLKKH